MGKKLIVAALLMLIPLAAVAGYLYFTGYWGPKVTLENARRIRAGMSESEVTQILGQPHESESVEIPDADAMLGGMFNLLGGLSGREVPKPNISTKKATVFIWKDGNKKIAVLFINHSVMKTITEGFGEENEKTSAETIPTRAAQTAPAKQTAPTKPRVRYFPFRRIAVLPALVPDDTSEAVKKEMVRLSSGLPVMLKKIHRTGGGLFR
jgi:hypothetical protein